MDFLVFPMPRGFQIHAPQPAQLAEFDFLYNAEKSATKFRQWKQGKIATIANHILTNDVKEPFISWLLLMSKQSFVGKNEKTVFDQTVRKSSEILPDQIQLDPEFFSTIASDIQELAQSLGHPTKVIAKLHKLVIYQQGDFFKTHVDSPHNNTEPMIFTASVQIRVDGWNNNGGHLVVGSRRIREVQREEIGVALFYHDQPHYVEKVDRGFRLSLIFDVVDSGIPNPEFHVSDDDSRTAFSKVIDMGFNNVAIRSSYTYMSKNQITADRLKGSDKVFYEAALAAGAESVEICRVCESDKKIFRTEVLDILKFEPGFELLYESARDPNDMGGEAEEEEEEEEDDDDEKESNTKKKRRIEGGEKGNNNKEEPVKLKRSKMDYDRNVSPLYDNNGTFKALRDEYRLGDTLFLAVAEVSKRVEFTGSDQVNLGNDGFSGEIVSNLAVIAHF